MFAKIKEFPWFLAAVLLICLWPIYGLRARNYRPLIGVSQPAVLPGMSAASLLDGSWQDAFNNWWPENIPGRSFLVRLRNEFVYTVLRTSSNNNIVIGRRGGLYEIGYLNNYCNYPQALTLQEIADRVEKLEQLQALMEAHGKSLYLFLTPSKVRFRPDDMPWYYDPAMHKVDEYEMMRAALQKTGLQWFDAIAFLQQNPDLLPTPYFYKTGIHWDTCWGAAAAIGLLDQMRQTGPYALGMIELKPEKADEAVDSNADMDALLNHFTVPKIENYWPIINEVAGHDRPNLFVRTSSFGHTSLKRLTDSKLFGATVYFENQDFISRNAAGAVATATVTAYDEIDIGAYLCQSDIIILELLETQYADLRFVDFILENPQLLDQ